MERKIGEIFELNGEWYQCVKGNTCNDCAFYRSSCGSLNGKWSCRYDFREDATNVIFKKLEKVGEPFACRNMSFGCYGIIVQRYKVFAEPILTDDSIRWCDSINKTILIALNNEEYMEKDNNTKHSNSEKHWKEFVCDDGNEYPLLEGQCDISVEELQMQLDKAKVIVKNIIYDGETTDS